MGRVSSRRWGGVVGLPVVGFALLWWAAEQLDAVRMSLGSTFEMPAWRFVGWLLTLIAAGVVFGLAAGFARAEVSKANVGATVVAGIIPLAIVVYFWAFFSFGWFSTFGGAIAFLVRNEVTVVVSCIVIGFLGAGLVAHRLTGLDKVRLVEVND
jgi:hypothetical protein